ncbi:similar to Saccharomyces cerevisiae YJL013C MAD3 Subunit of the spindle-assembly checkpoint complex, which delays anaphase onset in cells with defects in mitotic spindle assembly [Maudiozyma barnettii]|uniref:Similar to Saccharomyces cerevisiae YJL013C MAD3 Subunit of the spindle-assembly checkpoint complex, which delays anaphase onset in cells with defects in mitotic spindle assembly n=1 Tax=Maudiozyma barnettii TaxID=61262 RepID=A0A8H2VBV3_9SACH|nr:Mad3p [Kazachstania barnettii]CAB4252389.1 similar to Saccharomyces cerevisiae YJL013C MAD3 Subunit of the spindle-assembly checkpoint complex, which delays anaphase onset in cells with defects in mitotic spindle assembly [Kazachstania barnettii]CAD1779124.1 similar to Saccharomyces cerevisiae YJL013C MAD3 Subunit of the spindle-assembly checkpoint complex, which delays anaphase onset in cells with defects in mitotic spindle assembly [Kazachstania barnettii]
MESDLDDIVSFTHLENEKENIIPLRHGRSVKVLHEVLLSGTEQLDLKINWFEKRLEADRNDQFDTYVEYIDWLQESQFKGPNNILLVVIERCLTYMKNNEQYRNDTRYLKIWLLYINSFFQYSMRDRRDMFIYMFRNRIADSLTLYFIEFSRLLFDMRNYKECHDFLLIGIKNHALPAGQLLNKINEIEEFFQLNNISIESSDNNDQASIDNLLLKYGNISILNKDLKEILASKKIYNNNGSSNDKTKLDVREDNNDDAYDNREDCDSTKLEIFKDDSTGFETKASRLKENQSIVTPLHSNTIIEPMKQETKYGLSNVAGPSAKVSIFNDNIGRTKPVYKIISIDGQKSERIDCNFNLIYPEDNEFSVDQLLAEMRGCYNKSNKRKLNPSIDMTDGKINKRKLIVQTNE